MGIGLRFLVLELGPVTYLSNVFDKIFDWSVLFLFGVFTFLICLIECIKGGFKWRREKKLKN
jgi:hypothetical protein